MSAPFTLPYRIAPDTLAAIRVEIAALISGSAEPDQPAPIRSVDQVGNSDAVAKHPDEIRLAPAEPDTAVEARHIHLRRALEQAADLGAAMLDALGEAQLDALDAAIGALDALDADPDLEDDGGAEPYLAGFDQSGGFVDLECEPEHDQDGGDREAVNEDGDPLDDGEHDTADLEWSLGWNETISQLALGSPCDDGDAIALERHGRGFVRSGHEDAEDSDPAEDDGATEPGDGAWESAHDQSRWCEVAATARFYAIRTEGTCLHPVIPHGSRCIMDAEAPFKAGDFVVVIHDDRTAENGLGAKVKQLAHDLPWSTFPVVAEDGILPVISCRMLNPLRPVWYDPAKVHAVHKVVEVERPDGGRSYV